MITILASTKKIQEYNNNNPKYAFFDVDGILWDDSKSNKFLFTRITKEVKQVMTSFEAKIILVSNQTFGAKFIKNISIFRILAKVKYWFILNSNPEIIAAYICEHHPNATNLPYRKNCLCRKPNSELFHKALKNFNINPSNAITVGDRITDLYASSGAGIQSNFLLQNKRMFELNNTPNFDYEMKSVNFRFIESLIELNHYQQTSRISSPQLHILYLAAGMGSRLQPLTFEKHKSLLEIRGKTILSRLINGFGNNLQQAKHTVNISHFPEQFSKLNSELSPSIDLTYSYERLPLGGSQTVLNLANQGNYSNNFLVVHGDLYLSSDYILMVIAAISSSKHSIMFTHERVAGQARSEVVSSKAGLVLNFSNKVQNKKGTICVNSGIYYLMSKDLRNISSFRFPTEVSDGIIPKLIEQKRLKSVNLNLPRISIDSVDKLEQARKEVYL